MNSRLGQFRKSLAAVVAVARHPADVARLALAFDRDDGVALGWWLRKGLSPPARRALGAAVLADDDVVFQCDGGGFSWVFPTGDDIAVSLLSLGGFASGEALNLGAWCRANRPGGGEIVLEVGANVGTTTLPFAQDGWRVIAFEPVPRTYEFLERNVNANGLASRVTCVQAAVADRAGTVVMAVSRYLGGSHIVESNEPSRDGVAQVEVPVTTLNAALGEAGISPADVALVWCDAEGSESKVIAGGATLWAAGVPIYVECGLDEVEVLAKAAESHFGAFLLESEIRQHGTSARPHPIGEFAAFLSLLDGIDNALLLP